MLCATTTKAHCRSTSSRPPLPRAGEDAETMDRHIEESILWLLPKMDRNLWLVDTAVTLAPLLGLLGTIIGMIQSFNVLGSAAKGNPDMVDRRYRARAGGDGLWSADRDHLGGVPELLQQEEPSGAAPDGASEDHGHQPSVWRRLARAWPRNRHSGHPRQKPRPQERNVMATARGKETCSTPRRRGSRSSR